MISVESTDIDWAKVSAFFASKLRGDCPFRFGDTINFREQVTSKSAMNTFFVFVPSVLDKEYYLNIDIGAEYKIQLSGMYPMY
jgi:hypothetical protein